MKGRITLLSEPLWKLSPCVPSPGSPVHGFKKDALKIRSSV